MNPFWWGFIVGGGVGTFIGFVVCSQFANSEIREYREDFFGFMKRRLLEDERTRIEGEYIKATRLISIKFLDNMKFPEDIIALECAKLLDEIVALYRKKKTNES